MTSPLRIGTRGSTLAVTQTNHVADAIRLAHPELEIEIVLIQTRGDATQAANVPLSSFGEKGIFAKELETALLAGEIDLAIHSMKDLAHTLPSGLCIAAVPTREDSRDALIGGTLESLPVGARVGTGSVRRRALLHSRRPDLIILEIRGNIDTRLRRLDDGEYDAIVLAVAGLNRLGRQDRIAEILDPTWFVPDPAQGALALQTRENDHRVRDLLASINDDTSEACIRAERSFLRAVGGSCKTPVGALAVRNGDRLTLSAMLADEDGSSIKRAEREGSFDDPEGLGKAVADAI